MLLVTLLAILGGLLFELMQHRFRGKDTPRQPESPRHGRREETPADRHLQKRPEHAYVVGVTHQEPYMSYSLLNALAPYRDIENEPGQVTVADEIAELVHGLKQHREASKLPSVNDFAAKTSLTGAGRLAG